VEAQSNLGLMYAKGDGVPQDYAKARQWYEQAAAQGNAAAQNNLGTLYFKGEAVPQDYVLARHWYEKSAAQGNADAQLNLGALYENGQGVPQNFVQAYKWYILAGASGDNRGIAFRDDLAKRMTPAQIDEAQKLAREWKPKTP